MGWSRFYSDEQIDSRLESILTDFEMKYFGGYTYTTTTPDKRFKDGERKYTHYINSTSRERTSSERRMFIDELINNLNNNKTLDMHAYLQFFTFVRNPSFRKKGQRALKERIIVEYGDIPSYKDKLKEFISLYNQCKLFGWLLRWFSPKNSYLDSILKRVNTI